MVENAWKLATEARQGRVVDAVKTVSVDLWDWSRNVLGDLEKRIKRAKCDLERCRRGNIGALNVGREHILKYKLEKLEEQRDLYWRQRAHVHWLKNGDKNTKFFHLFASERKRRNRIKKLKREDGSEVVDAAGMLELITNYYSALFTSNAGDRVNELLQYVQPKVSDDMNQGLMAEYTTEEIKLALDSMGLKAPGTDGMPALFYKKIGILLGRM